MFDFINVLNVLCSVNLADGFSVNGAGSAPVVGYMVSLPDCERTFAGLPKLWQVVKYVEDYKTHLHNPCLYVGAWLDAETGTFYLDISENVQDKETALQLGRERKQLAIFDLSTFDSIYL